MMDVTEQIQCGRAHQGKRLKGKVAVITGGARGLGAAAAKLFAEHGAHVVVADILDDLGSELAELIGGRYIHCNVARESDVESAVNLAVTWKGHLDIMFNNAGIPGPGGSIVNLDMKKLNDLLAVNVNGIIHGVKHAAAAMIKGNRKGSIICTSSSAAILGGLGGHAYTMSKQAILGLLKSTACELGLDGIRVNCISPHGVPTDMLLSSYRKCLQNMDLGPEEVGEIIGENGSLIKGRSGRLEDIAEAALFLASDDTGGFITGHNLVVDGGFTTSCCQMSFIYK